MNYFFSIAVYWNFTQNVVVTLRSSYSREHDNLFCEATQGGHGAYLECSSDSLMPKSKDIWHIKYHNINDPASFLHLQPMDNKNSICVLPCFQHPCNFQAATTIYKQITIYVEYR